MKFCDKLQNLRKENNLSQEQLADMLDVSRQSVSKWENGTTYPEMDKLIQLTKIFKCSLDDLTNDEVSTSSIKEHQKGISNLVDEITNIIKKSFNALKNMSLKDYIALGIELVLLLILFKICFEPFSYIENGLSEIFYNFGNRIGALLSDIFGFIIEIAYILLCIVLLGFIYKVRFLDRFGNKEPKDEIVDEDKSITTDEKENNERVRVHHDNHIMDILINIVLFFIKFLVFICTCPVLVGVLVISAGFIVSIILLFYGITYLGVGVSLLFSIVLSVFILELVFDFLFNKRIHFKRLLITFIAGVIGLGFGIGLFCIDVSNTKFIDSVPNGINKVTKKEEFLMNDNLYLQDHLYFLNVKYVESNINNIVVEYTFYPLFNEISIKNNEDNLEIISHQNESIDAIQKYKTMIIDDLKNKKIHNYEKLYEVELTVYGNKLNLSKIQENNKNNYSYEEDDDYYDNQIDDLEAKNDKLINENDNLKDENEELKNKLQEYRDRVSELLEN